MLWQLHLMIPDFLARKARQWTLQDVLQPIEISAAFWVQQRETKASKHVFTQVTGCSQTYPVEQVHPSVSMGRRAVVGVC